MKVTVLLLALASAFAFAVDNTVVAPQSTANPQSAVVGHRSPVINGPEAITIPQMLSYQGKLTDTTGVPVPNSDYSVTFALYTTSSGGSPFWSEAQSVTTKDGLFSVLLGAVTPINSVPDAGALYLGMAVAGGAELSPRLPIASAAYAYLTARAANADQLQGRDTTTFSRSTHNHDATYVNEAQADAVTSAMMVNGTIAAPDLGQMGAGTGQVMKWTGSAWAPRNDSVGGGGGGGTVTSVSQATGVVCTPNPITSAGTVGFDQTYGDGRYVNVSGDSMTGALALQSDLRVYGRGRFGSNCVLSGSNAFVVGDSCVTGGNRAVAIGGWHNRATAADAATVGGAFNSAQGLYSYSAGYSNDAYGKYSAVLSGRDNIGGYGASDSGAVVSGGLRNEAGDFGAAVGGGVGNIAFSAYATVAGGSVNEGGGIASAVAGGDSNYAGAYCAIGGGHGDSARGYYAGVFSGYHNRTLDSGAAVAGGFENEATGRCAYVGGGRGNSATNYNATVCGGNGDTASGSSAFVGGGVRNTASGSYATVSGGVDNTASSSYSTVSGGRDGIASAIYATVPGGRYNAARGEASMAAGNLAKANHTNCFVWGDSAYLTQDSVYSTGANQWRVRARGGAWFFSNKAMTTGAYLAPGSNSWESACDSTTKEDFRPVDRKVLLDKVAALNVRDYKMKDQDDGTRHIGPVAQDFHNAFGYGGTETGINLADADGVLLAAVQALCDEMKAVRELNAAQQDEIEVLKAELRRR